MSTDKYGVRDLFEIRTEYRTGHDPGLVVVLDGRVTMQPAELVGMAARIHLPDGKIADYTIDGVKDHIATTSLFFRGKSMTDVPRQSLISVIDTNPTLR